MVTAENKINCEGTYKLLNKTITKNIFPESFELYK